MISSAALDIIAGQYEVIGNLPRTALDSLRAEARTFQASAGTRMFEVGDPCQGFPLLIEGEIQVERMSASGRRILLYTLAPGDSCILSVSSLLGQGRYPASGIVSADAVGATIPRPEFIRLLEKEELFRTYVFRFFSERITSLMSLIEDLACHKIGHRLGRILADGPAKLEMTHQDLASRLGTIREVISRNLKEFEDKGWIKLGRGRIEIIDAAMLKKNR